MKDIANINLIHSFARIARCSHNVLKVEHTKIIHRHIWHDFLDEVEHLRHTNENKEIYAMRKETIERVFADLKEKHGMRWNLGG
ncbi:hypothetical protein J2S00_004031 [Caldalkalibacillus uzonensis]|uniref:Transposase DDE domain-containing protein n=1 Tax=Caldalkalibacillus uzonensis TaxID=353224 RepID=A0ABU0CYH4_9BACI|nr:transposase [Caldalkalibacillus uzonensis]MDQ0341187.1 hypothetical protein [Caldalkalibacillus uzonensis]